LHAARAKKTGISIILGKITGRFFILLVVYASFSEYTTPILTKQSGFFRASPDGKRQPLLFYVVFLPEAFNTAGCVNKLLFTGKEGVAGGTDFYFYILDGGTGFNNIPADAGNGGHFVFRVYLFFHK
jgi:hypothetical protein